MHSLTGESGVGYATRYSDVGPVEVRTGDLLNYSQATAAAPFWIPGYPHYYACTKTSQQIMSLCYFKICILFCLCSRQQYKVPQND